MPHYADGSLARVSDVVVGTTYNQPGEVIGIIVKITFESETCNCRVHALARKVDGAVLRASDTDYGEVRAFRKVL